MDRSERVVKLQNFTNDTVLFFDFLTQYPKNQVPRILQVRMEGGDTIIHVLFTLVEYREVQNYIKNNR